MHAMDSFNNASALNISLWSNEIHRTRAEFAEYSHIPTAKVSRSH